MIFKKIILTISFAFLIFSPAYSQTSLSDIQAAVGNKASELEQVNILLADPDSNRRLAAMELLITSGNPIFVKRAKEAGLFSSDPEMRSAALKATLDSGGPFRIQLALDKVDHEKSQMINWLSNAKGIWNTAGTEGSYVFNLGPYSEKLKCWTVRLNSNNCSIRLTGGTITIRWPRSDGSFTINNEGILQGQFRASYYKGAPVPATIDLAE